MAQGVIDPDRFVAAHERRGVQLAAEHGMDLPPLDPKFGPTNLPSEFRSMLRWPIDKPIHLTRDNAGIYINLLWPLGLSNQLPSNENSPVNGEYRTKLASTSGWTLGRNGPDYFNSLKIVELTADQEALAVGVADNVFRPCCNNSTFFQDCNHGSA